MFKSNHYLNNTFHALIKVTYSLSALRGHHHSELVGAVDRTGKSACSHIQGSPHVSQHGVEDQVHIRVHGALVLVQPGEEGHLGNVGG